MRWLAVLVLCTAANARADSQCHEVAVSFVPTSDQLQIVAWLEQPDGTYVDTIYITQKVGHYGLGNRPGEMEFNSGPVVHDMWPYGKRTTTFPVWAHRHGKTFPLVIFQNGEEADPGGAPFDQSTPEHTPPYCRPILPSEPAWDTGTCATTVGTDKGTFDPSGAHSLYPPRADLTRYCNSNVCDSPSVDQYKALDVFDAVAQATPLAGALAQMQWTIPPTLSLGNYVLFVEVAEAFDFNATYNATTFPPPSVPFGDYGEPYRGQPSIVYRVPITIGAGLASFAATDYAGYGDPTGATGALNRPDATITTDTPGSGASRLSILPGSSDRIEVTTHVENDATPPAPVGSLRPTQATGTAVTLQFVAPGDDGLAGTVTGYDVRYRTRDPLTAANFDDTFSMPALTSLAPLPSGSLQTLELDGLMPETSYWIGVRPFDDCGNRGDVAVIEVTTAARQAGAVDACFVATAAYGSKMAGDVELLRHVRDALLRRSVLGELAIETYYTFGPPVAGVVGESDLLRRASRDVLAPVIARVRELRY